MDVVLALLRTEEPRMLACAEALVGRRVLRCPPSLRVARAKVEWSDPVGPELAVITHVAPNPRLPTTGAWYRYRVLKPGMTVQQALIRGARKRDIRLARRRGWIQLQEVGEAR